MQEFNFGLGSEDGELPHGSIGILPNNNVKTLSEAKLEWRSGFSEVVADIANECSLYPHEAERVSTFLINQLTKCSVTEALKLSRAVCLIALSKKSLTALFMEKMSSRIDKIDDYNGGSYDEEDEDSAVKCLATEIDKDSISIYLTYCIELIGALSQPEQTSAATSHYLLKTLTPIELLTQILSEDDGEEVFSDPAMEEAINYNNRNPQIEKIGSGMYDLDSDITKEFISAYFDKLVNYWNQNNEISIGVIANLIQVVSSFEADDDNFEFDSRVLVAEELLKFISEADVENAQLLGKTYNALDRYLRVVENDPSMAEKLHTPVVEWCTDQLGIFFTDPANSDQDKVSALIVFLCQSETLIKLFHQQLKEIPESNRIPIYKQILSIAEKDSEVLASIVHSETALLLLNEAFDPRNESIKAETKKMIEKSLFSVTDNEAFIGSYLIFLSYLNSQEAHSEISNITGKLKRLSSDIAKNRCEDSNHVVDAFVGRIRHILGIESVSARSLIPYCKIIDQICEFPESVFYTNLTHKKLKDCYDRLSFVTALLPEQEKGLFKDTLQKLNQKLIELFILRPWSAILDEMPPGIVTDKATYALPDGSNICFVAVPKGMREEDFCSMILSQDLKNNPEPVILFDSSKDICSIVSDACKKTSSSLAENIFGMPMFTVKFKQPDSNANFDRQITSAFTTINQNSKATVYILDPQNLDTEEQSFLNDISATIAVLPITSLGRVGLFTSKDELNQYETGLIPVQNASKIITSKNQIDSAASYGLNKIHGSRKALFIINSQSSGFNYVLEVLEAEEDSNFEAPITRALMHEDALVVLPQEEFEKLPYEMLE